MNYINTLVNKRTLDTSSRSTISQYLPKFVALNNDTNSLTDKLQNLLGIVDNLQVRINDDRELLANLNNEFRDIVEFQGLTHYELDIVSQIINQIDAQLEDLGQDLTYELERQYCIECDTLQGMSCEICDMAQQCDQTTESDEPICDLVDIEEPPTDNWECDGCDGGCDTSQADGLDPQPGEDVPGICMSEDSSVTDKCSGNCQDCQTCDVVQGCDGCDEAQATCSGMDASTPNVCGGTDSTISGAAEGCHSFNEDGSCTMNNSLGDCQMNNTTGNCDSLNSVGNCNGNNKAGTECESAQSNQCANINSSGNCTSNNEKGNCSSYNNVGNCLDSNDLGKCTASDNCHNSASICSSGQGCNSQTCGSGQGTCSGCNNCNSCDSCDGGCESCQGGDGGCYTDSNCGGCDSDDASCGGCYGCDSGCEASNDDCGAEY